MNNHFDHSSPFLKFQQRFQSEQACEDYLFKLRWPRGFICPTCHDTEFYHLNTRRAFKCKRNGHQTFLTAGTVMRGSGTPLSKWFCAAYLLSKAKDDVSASRIHEVLKVRYETAYNILHKLRATMVNSAKDKIGFTVELDDTYIASSVALSKKARGPKGPIVMVAVEKRNGQGGRIRLRHIKDLSEQSIVHFIKDSVEEGATIRTNKFKSYSNLNLRRYGYALQPIIRGKTGRTIIRLS